MWSVIGKAALKIALWAIGHQDVITHVIADAKAKNIPALVTDAAAVGVAVKTGS